MDLEDFIKEEPAQNEGIWVDHPTTDLSFKIASSAQDKYQDFMAQRFNTARRGRRDIPPDVSRRIVSEGIIRFLLKDWKNVTENGKPVPFSPENARRMIEGKSPLAASVREFIVEQATNLDHFVEASLSHDGAEPEKTEGGSASAAEALKRGSDLVAPVGEGTSAATGTS